MDYFQWIIENAESVCYENTLDYYGGRRLIEEECGDIEFKNMNLLNEITEPVELYKLILRECGLALEWIEDYHNLGTIYLELCMIAVKQNGYALRYVKTQTSEICLEAVKRYGMTLKYVERVLCEESYDQICLEAIKNDHRAIQWVTDSSLPSYYDMCMTAVKKDGVLLEYVIPFNEKLYKKVCTAAIKNNGWAIRFVSRVRLNEVDYDELCLMAVNKEGLALQCVDKKTYEVYVAAINHNASALHFIDNVSDDLRNILCLTAAKRDGYILRYINNQTSEICLAAVRQNGLALQYVKTQTKEICKEAVKQNHDAIQYIRDINLRKIVSQILVDAEENDCCVCYDKCITMTSCSHQLCKRCYDLLVEKKCPLCRSCL